MHNCNFVERRELSVLGLNFEGFIYQAYNNATLFELYQKNTNPRYWHLSLIQLITRPQRPVSVLHGTHVQVSRNIRIHVRPPLFSMGKDVGIQIFAYSFAINSRKTFKDLGGSKRAQIFKKKVGGQAGPIGRQKFIGKDTRCNFNPMYS